MKRLLITSAAAILGLAGAAYAQPMPQTPAVPSTPVVPATPPAASTPATPDMPASETPAPPAAPAPPPATPDTGVTAATPQATSATSASSNTTATATTPSTSTYLGAGLQVRDSSGASLGRITHLTVSGHDTMATIRIGRRDVTVPLSSLHLEGRYAVSSQTRADLEGQQTTAPAQ